MSKNIGDSLDKLGQLTPEEWKKLREKIDADNDKETEEDSKKVLTGAEKLRKPPTPTK
jgi:hypothetical protein